MEERNQQEEIKDKYLSTKTPVGFTSLSQFIENTDYGPKDKQKVKDTLSSLNTYSIHKPIRKKYQRTKVMVNFIDHTWALDLAVFESTKRSNSFYAYIMFVSDIFSRYTWSIPIKKKDTKSVLEGFKELFEKTDRRPVNIWSDAERAFFSKEVLSMLKKEGIKIYHTHSKLKSVYSELTVKHLKSRLFKYMTFKKTKNWLTALEDVTNSYNHTKQRLLGMSPAEVNETNQHIVWHRRYHSIVKKGEPTSALKVGDYVRIGRTKIELGRKGYSPNWSEEIFRIKLVKKTRPVLSFVLEDLSGEEIQGRFLEPELNQVPFPVNSDNIQNGI